MIERTLETEAGWKIALRRDEPCARIAAHRVLETVLGAAAIGGREDFRCVIEIERHVGSIVHRALLGGRFVPGSSGSLHVQVHCDDERRTARLSCESRLGGTLLSGLPEEFGRAMMDVVDRSDSCREIGSGILTIDRSAYDDESSVMTFRFAVTVLCRAVNAGAFVWGFDDSFRNLPRLEELWYERKGLA